LIQIREEDDDRLAPIESFQAEINATAAKNR
jgi:hypothetical protein